MSARPLMILAVAALLLGGVVFFGNRPPAVSDSASALFAPQLAERLDDVTTIRVVGPGDATVATLSRTEDDWVVADRGGYRANANTIRSALTQLSRASVIEAKTTNAEEFARLGVEDLTAPDAGGIGLEFLPESLGLPGIVLGDTSGTSYRYARLTDSNQSWLINADPEVPAETAQWLDAEILDIASARVERIVIRHADGETLDIFKSTPEQTNFEVADIPEGRSLQYPGVANVLGNALRNLRLEDVTAAPADRGEPAVTTEYQTFDGLLLYVTGYDVDGTGWLEFAAAIDEQFSNPDAAVAAEAEAITARTAGWRYRIAQYQYNQFARRMTDLLSAPESEE